MQLIRKAFSSLTPREGLCLGFGLALTHAFYVHLLYFPSEGDTNAYRQAAFDIVRFGLDSKWFLSEMRTYGYPLFLSLIFRLTNLTHLPLALLICEVQLLLFFGATLCLRAQLARLSPFAGEIAFCGIALNYYALLYIPYAMTESISLTLIVAVAACWVSLHRNPSALWPLLIGSVLVGFSVMVRPANLFLVAAWVIGCLVVFNWEIRRSAALLARTILVAAAIALPCVPQFLNNLHNFNRPTPLVVSTLSVDQFVWGIAYSKYATGVVPYVDQPRIFYDNPFSGGTAVGEVPLHWYLENPMRGASTAALHIFNMTDQDLLFTYARDLDPWYRIPLGVINHAAVALGLFGLGLLWRKAWRHRNRGAFQAAITVSALLASCCAIYATTVVEMRFGLPLLLALFPLAAYTLYDLKDRDSHARRRVMAGAGIYVTIALVISDWVRGLAPQIAQS